MRQIAIRWMRALAEAVVRFGLLWHPVPPPEWPPEPHTAPPPRHPERLCPGDLPAELRRLLRDGH
jgi:hypothetical protein